MCKGAVLDEVHSGFNWGKMEKRTTLGDPLLCDWSMIIDDCFKFIEIFENVFFLSPHLECFIYT